MGGGDHCGDPLQTIAVGSHLRQSPRKKLWGVTSGSPPTAIVSGDSPQRVAVCHTVQALQGRNLLQDDKLDDKSEDKSEDLINLMINWENHILSREAMGNK